MMLWRDLMRVVCLLAVLSMFAVTTYAYPPFAATNGNSCKSCHGGVGLPGKLTVLNDGSLLDPDESATGAKDRGSIKVYDVVPGDTVTLSMEVLDGSKNYAVQIKRFEKAGVVSGSTLVYSADSSWTAQSSGGSPPYYTIPGGFSAISWDAQSQKIFDFDLKVDASTPVDVYDLEFAAAGDGSSGMWYGDEHFYVNVIPEPASAALVSSALGMLMLRRRR